MVGLEESESQFGVSLGGAHTLLLASGDGALIYDGPPSLEHWGWVLRAARAADWVALIAGRPACLVDERQRAELPEALRADAVVAGSAAELAACCRGVASAG